MFCFVSLKIEGPHLKWTLVPYCPVSDYIGNKYKLWRNFGNIFFDVGKALKFVKHVDVEISSFLIGRRNSVEICKKSSFDVDCTSTRRRNFIVLCRRKSVEIHNKCSTSKFRHSSLKIDVASGIL